MPANAPKRARTRKSPAKKKRSRGRPRHVPTEDTNNLVRGLAMAGTSHESMCAILIELTGQAVSATTLRKHYDLHLKYGSMRANARVAAALYNAAIQVDKDPKFIQAAIFWAKTRMKWREHERQDDILSDALRALEKADLSRDDKNKIKTELEEFMEQAAEKL